MPLSLQWLAVAVLTLVVHKDVYTIPFHYTEVPGILRSPVVRDLDVFYERMLTPKGLLQRPLSVLSYALNHATSGGRPAPYHATNVAIHCVNIGLVMVVARHLSLPPLVAGSIFALHPLATACVSQIFGRNYSLACMFSFLAFYLYLRWRERPRMSRAQLLAIGSLFLLSVLAKQSLVVFPLILLWYEISLHRGALRHAARSAVSFSPRAAAVTLVAGGLGIALIVFYAVPGSKTAAVSSWTYFVSELAVAPTLVRFYVLPYQTALTHDLPFYRSAAHPDVWLGAVLVAALVFCAVRWRAHGAGWLLGALLISLVPTNTLLPKDELIREWRLYPSLLFFALLSAGVFAELNRRLRDGSPFGRVTLVRALLALWLASFAHADLTQNRIYGTPVATWEQVLEKYPRSGRALSNIGLQYYLRRDFEKARHYYEGAVEIRPDVHVYRKGLANVHARLGDDARAEQVLAEGTAVYGRYGRGRPGIHFK